MPINTEVTVIDGKKYTYTQLSASRSMILKFSIGKVLNRCTTPLMLGAKTEGDMQMMAFMDTIGKVLEANEPEQVFALVEQILEPVKVDGVQLPFDVAYTGDLELAWKVLFWVLKVEYQDFFQKLLAQYHQAQPPTATEAQSKSNA